MACFVISLDNVTFRKRYNYNVFKAALDVVVTFVASSFADVYSSTIWWGNAVLLNLYVFIILFLLIGIHILGLIIDVIHYVFILVYKLAMLFVYIPSSIIVFDIYLLFS